MKSLLKFFRSITTEVLVVFFYIFLLNNYIKNVKDTINSDGVGYYDYLPSIFIHNDIVRKDDPVDVNPKKYERVNTVPFYNSYNNYEVIKYGCGTALLQAPFFTFSLLLADPPVTGYEPIFHQFIFYASVFYVFLSLIFLRKILQTYNIHGFIIFFVQLLTVLATSVTIYMQFNASYSHVYSLFAVTAFIYFSRQYFLRKNLSDFIWTAIFLGLIFDIRIVNVLIVLFLPFVAGSWTNFVSGFRHMFSNWKFLAFGSLSFLLVAFIQFYLWYLQTGNFVIYSYSDEFFNFADPYFYSILFSYKKGLFVYTPVLFIACLSTLWFVYRKKYYSFFTWFGFFILITYVLSSWWSWYYGCSFGLRAYIDFYAVFFIPMAIALNEMNKWMKAAVVTLSLATIPINIIQTYQYKNFILDWINMNKESYWEVFLKTSDRYVGLISKQRFDMSNYTIPKEFVVENITITPNFYQEIFRIQTKDIPDLKKVKNFQFSFENYIPEASNAHVTATVTGPNYDYYHKIPFIHFRENGFDRFQRGLYTYTLNFENASDENIVTLVVESDKDTIRLSNARLTFMIPKHD